MLRVGERAMRNVEKGEWKGTVKMGEKSKRREKERGRGKRESEEKEHASEK